MEFQPDHRNLVLAARNQRPPRLPLYEHIIAPQTMERVLGRPFAALRGGDAADRAEFYRQYCRFFREMTYDTVSFEFGVLSAMPDSGAILGGRPGPIQSRADFESYPWDEIPRRFWELAEPHYRDVIASLPEGMKLIGGVGYGIFEISEDLVGYEHLCYLQADDPELFGQLYARIGRMMRTIWQELLARHAEAFAVCRFGDDLGFKTGTLLSPDALRQHVVPQYRPIIEAIHRAGKPFLYHSCGRIFDVMDDAIAAGIDAKHSNEDIIAPFETWIDRYGERIGLFGGVDVDVLCQRPPQEVFEHVVDLGRRCRAKARGYALGSGNSIPDYVPVEGYLAMVRAAQEIRRREA